MFCFLLHRVPIATDTKNLLCCRCGAPQAHLGLTGPFSGYKIPKKSKKPFFVKKKTIFLFLFCFRILSQCDHPHRHVEHIMLQTRSAAGALARSTAALQARSAAGA